MHAKVTVLNLYNSLWNEYQEMLIERVCDTTVNWRHLVNETKH